MRGVGAVANPYMPFYTGDYLRKTRRLIDREHGAYLLILFAMWDEGGSLPHDMEELRIIAKVPKRARHWEETWSKLEPFFIITEGRIRHAKVDETLEQARVKRELRARSGALGGAAKQKNRKKNSGANLALPQQSYSNQTKGLVSSLREEKPNLVIEQKRSSVAVSPPSPLVGGGETTEAEHIRHLRRYLQSRVDGLMTAYVLSAREVRDLKDGIRGGSEECLLLASSYEPPDPVRAALASIAIDWTHPPKLKTIEGGRA